MKPLTGSIDPQPAESGSPQKQPHILAFGAGYLYRGGTTYHFTAEYIPDYVIQNEKKTKFCIWYQQYKYSPELEAAWKEILASKAPTKYMLSIRNTDFYGEIDDVPQSTLFKSFLAEGATDCGEQPTRRF
jgi:ABC-type branched-subunit amino acid transport system substrate-binding protein